MNRNHAGRFGGALLAFALLGAACGQQPPTQTAVQAQAQQPQQPRQPAEAARGVQPDYRATYVGVRDAYKHMFDTGDALAGAIAKQKNLGDIKAGASDVRVTLDRQLAEHAFLAVFAMQKGLDGNADFGAIADALDGNSQDLAATVGSVYGVDAQNAFLKQWRDHIRMFVDFTVATAKNDAAGRQKALGELTAYKQSFSDFMSKATGAPQTAVADALQHHVMQLTQALDTYKAKDYAGTYQNVRTAYAHMYDTGDALAGAIAKQKNLGDIKAGASDVRVTLDRQLAEHAFLAVFAMQKGVQGKPDFQPIAEALDRNSQDLAATVGSVYGVDAQNAFLKQWRDHIRMFVDFTVATAKNDAAGRQRALNELSAYRQSFSDFMSKATGAPQTVVADALQHHVMQLTQALDDYVSASKK